MRKLFVLLNGNGFKWLKTSFLVINLLLTLVAGFLVFFAYPNAISNEVKSTKIHHDSSPIVGNSKENISMIVVDLGGSVNNPGVYRLPVGARMADLIDSAGGFDLKTTDAYSVQKNLNLAELVEDGRKYYIPFSNESVELVAKSNLSNLEVVDSVNSSLISINQATLKSLMSLPGIGEVRAQAIIDGRQYLSLDELKSKSILTEKLFNDIKDLISI